MRKPLLMLFNLIHSNIKIPKKNGIQRWSITERRSTDIFLSWKETTGKYVKRKRQSAPEINN